MNLKQSQLNKLKETLEMYDVGDIINPHDFKEKLFLTSQENQRLFSCLSSFGIFKHVYRYYCPTCNHLSYDTYNSLEEIDNIIECENCYHELPEGTYKYIAIYFEVVRDE